MHIVSGTPGRVFDMIKRRSLRTRNIKVRPVCFHLLQEFAHRQSSTIPAVLAYCGTAPKLSARLLTPVTGAWYRCRL